MFHTLRLQATVENNVFSGFFLKNTPLKSGDICGIRQPEVTQIHASHQCQTEAF